MSTDTILAVLLLGAVLHSTYSNFDCCAMSPAKRVSVLTVIYVNMYILEYAGGWNIFMLERLRVWKMLLELPGIKEVFLVACQFGVYT